MRRRPGERAWRQVRGYHCHHTPQAAESVELRRPLHPDADGAAAALPSEHAVGRPAPGRGELLQLIERTRAG